MDKKESYRRGVEWGGEDIIVLQETKKKKWLVVDS